MLSSKVDHDFYFITSVENVGNKAVDNEPRCTGIFLNNKDMQIVCIKKTYLKQ